MARLPETFNFDESELQTPSGIRQVIDRLYTDLARAINGKPDLTFKTIANAPSDLSTSDSNLSNGTINVNTDTNKVEMVTNHVNSNTITITTLS